MAWYLILTMDEIAVFLWNRMFIKWQILWMLISNVISAGESMSFKIYLGKHCFKMKIYIVTFNFFIEHDWKTKGLLGRNGNNQDRTMFSVPGRRIWTIWVRTFKFLTCTINIRILCKDKEAGYVHCEVPVRSWPFIFVSQSQVVPNTGHKTVNHIMTFSCWIFTFHFYFCSFKAKYA